ncbi:MAG TPA: NADH-quinone oxidoreductase subunit C [Burkholderiales bacterium]|nr:NADH-quinone oxidoreductase subunit C [Burkholderiales bacterium]
MSRTETLAGNVQAALGAGAVSVAAVLDEVTLTLGPDDLVAVMTVLRDAPELRFEQLIDLCGVDYAGYGDGVREGRRFAVVYHLLSVTHNQRLRVRVFAADDGFPALASMTGVWPSANWFEREAFDLFGVVFTGHPDLRRILTDYGFIGHPFRKDFPLSGNVEMRYDADQQRVIYQPVTIEPREIVPRIVREQDYADTEGFRKG